MSTDDNFGPKTRSILKDMYNTVSEKDKIGLVDTRSTNIIVSASHLLEMLEQNFSKDDYEVLQKRFMLAIKNRDPKRFSRTLQRLRKKDKE